MATLRDIYNTKDPNYSPANIPGAVKREQGGYEIPTSEMLKLTGPLPANIESRAPGPLYSQVNRGGGAVSVSEDFADNTPFGATGGTSGSLRAPSGTVGSAGGGPRTPTGVTQTTKTVYEGEAPKYKGPTYDEGKIKSLARKLAGPSIRRARLALSQALNQYYENPAMRGIVVRQALEGYGISVEQARASAYGQAGSMYGQEYQAQANEAIRNYQAARDAYLSTAKQISTQKNIYGSEGAEEGTSGPGVYRFGPWGGGLTWSAQ